MASIKSKKEFPSEAYIKIRERKKWQLALRRYVIHGVRNDNYAPYFGLDSKTLRDWFEMQFPTGVSWADFASLWQFDHIVPVVYFDFSSEDELKLCWNFTNLRVVPTNLNRNRGNRIDVLAAKSYFVDLFEKTGYSLCKKMVDKINEIEVSNIECNDTIIHFMKSNQQRLETIASLNHYEFNRFNQGTPIDDIILERELLKKFGS